MAARLITLDAFAGFACKCGDCRRTCCRDWEVRLSRTEFQSARSRQRDPALHTLAVHNLRPNSKRQNENEYALCRMRSDGFCSFLSPAGLCQWRLLGSEPLCATCGDFPFTYIAYQDDTYAFPSLSCEAIAEPLIQRGEPLRLQAQDPAPPRAQWSVRIEPDHFARRPLLAHYSEVMEWSLQLLQNRSYRLDSRMALLANAMSLIDWLERSQRLAELPEARQKFLQPEKLEETLHGYDQYTIGPKALLAVNAHLLLPFVDHPLSSQTVRAVLQGLGIAFEAAPPGSEQPYRLLPIDLHACHARKQALHEWFLQKETFMEHVLVCEFLRGLIPFSAPSVWQSFQFFNASYALLKGMLLGRFDQPPSDAELIETLQTLYRVFVHFYGAGELTAEWLQALQISDLLSTVALAKG